MKRTTDKSRMTPLTHEPPPHPRPTPRIQTPGELGADSCSLQHRNLTSTQLLGPRRGGLTVKRFIPYGPTPRQEDAPAPAPAPAPPWMNH
ncbi:unnamed protein product [Coffea canephora]|uniref:Uncharacterized protein n=1 Tax=Coffea canephora TaxID=49390 RepID=A0A068U1J1_COFCA|nr:unnamed protein product [Coffea canephora]